MALLPPLPDDGAPGAASDRCRALVEAEADAMVRARKGAGRIGVVRTMETLFKIMRVKGK